MADPCPEGAVRKGIELAQDFAGIPLYFVLNAGQARDGVLYHAQASHYRLAVTREWISFNGSRLEFPGANPNPDIVPLEKADYRVNYFLGSDPSKWIQNIPSAESLLFREVYERIDLKLRGTANRVEYDWIIRPGGDPGHIRIEFSEIREAEINRDGDLVVLTDWGRLVNKKPYAFQRVDGRREIVKASFRRTGARTFGFSVGDFDHARELVIDPVVLAYSTYLGGSLNDYASGIALDDRGSAYVTGKTRSPDFPTRNPFLKDRPIEDAYVTKISPSGRSLVYSTYLGGSDYDYALSIAVDGAGCAYVTGGTWSSDFPTRKPFRSDLPERDAFVAKLSPEGNALVFSTYLGGSGWDEAYGIDADNAGNVYVTGRTESEDFPVLNSCQRDRPLGDAFVTKFAPGGRKLVYSTYLGGSGLDYGRGVAADGAGNAYIAGYTESGDLPLKNPFQKNEPGPDAFVAKIGPLGKTLVFSTYFGGNSFDKATAVRVDNAGNVYVTGGTDSTDFPLKNPFQSDRPGRDAFAAKLTPSGNALVYSTYLGGGDDDFAWGIAVDGAGNACLAGETRSRDFPLKNRYQGDQPDWDAFAAKLSAAGKLVYSTYLGGSGEDYAYDVAADRVGNAYVVGWTSSPDFPTVKPFQKDEDDWDAFVTKISFFNPSGPGRQPPSKLLLPSSLGFLGFARHVRVGSRFGR